MLVSWGSAPSAKGRALEGDAIVGVEERANLAHLMVFDLSGVHRLVVRYCGCREAPSKYIQLLRARWFSATIDRLSTVFAFDVLDFFHKLQNQNKCNPYDFYNAIIQRTDAAGLNPEIVRFFCLICGALTYCPPVPV